MRLPLSTDFLSLAHAMRRLTQMAEVIDTAGIEETYTLKEIETSDTYGDALLFNHEAVIGDLASLIWELRIETASTLGGLRTFEGPASVCAIFSLGNDDDVKVEVGGYVEPEGVWHWNYAYEANADDTSLAFSGEIGKFLFEEELRGDDGDLTEERALELFQLIVRDFASRMPAKTSVSV